jgi:type VI secretion system protein ImpK
MMSDSIATLMRATALYAALLRGGAEIPPVHVWRARCSALVETLRQAMQDVQCPAAYIDEVSLAQSVLLDELTLRALPLTQQGEWARESLQMRFHGLRDGASRVWERIDALLDHGRHDRAALELYGILLELGFSGGRADADACRRRVKLAVRRLAYGEGAAPVPATSIVSPPRVSDRSRARSMSSASRPRWIVIGSIVAAMAVLASLWIVFNASLHPMIDRLPRAYLMHDLSVQGGRSS